MKWFTTLTMNLLTQMVYSFYSHRDAKGSRNKSFLFYDELFQVFGKDRADGKGVQSSVDAMGEIIND